MKKRIYRIAEGRRWAGVCTGLAEHYSVDPAVFRCLFAACAAIWGVGIAAYLLCIRFMAPAPTDPVTRV